LLRFHKNSFPDAAESDLRNSTIPKENIFAFYGKIGYLIRRAFYLFIIIII
jgi:hypothetical protein